MTKKVNFLARGLFLAIGLSNVSCYFREGSELFFCFQTDCSWYGGSQHLHCVQPLPSSWVGLDDPPFVYCWRWSWKGSTLLTGEAHGSARRGQSESPGSDSTRHSIKAKLLCLLESLFPHPQNRFKNNICLF